MLNHKAFQELPSTKRGHKIGDTEKLVEQSVRVITNVKARQTKAQNESMERIESLIQERDMLDHKVLLFLLEPGEIDKNLSGLVANKIMAKYQRPVCILTKTTQVIPHTYNECPGVIVDEYETIYQGSARGCDKIGIYDFKGICANTGLPQYTIGHPGAFGLSLKTLDIDNFIEQTDVALADMPDEAVYYVDYIYDTFTLRGEDILEIADMEYLWGKDIDEPFVVVKNISLTADMVTIYDKKGYTIKIQLPSGIALMLFNATEQDCEVLQINNTGNINIDIVGTCQKNEWMGKISPQIFITEYQIVKANKFVF